MQFMTRYCIFQGFIVNRLLMPMLNEAFFALMEVRECGMHI